MTLATPIGAGPAGRVRRHLTGPLLVASQEDVPVSGALRVAEALARRDEVHAYLLGSGAGLTGTVAAARDRDAEYVLTALPPVGKRGRTALLDDAMQVAGDAGIPVLLVAPETESLPRRALAEMDSGEASMSAAAAALALLESDGSLTLGSGTPAEVRALRGFADTLGALSRRDVSATVIPAGPLVLAKFVGKYDLVAVPSESADPVLLGSAKHSLLIVPPA